MTDLLYNTAYYTGYYAGVVGWYAGKTVVMATTAVVSGLTHAALGTMSTHTTPTHSVQPIIPSLPSSGDAADPIPALYIIGMGIPLVYVMVAWIGPCVYRSIHSLLTRLSNVVFVAENPPIPQPPGLPIQQAPVLPINPPIVDMELNLDHIPNSIADYEYEQCCICLSNKKNIAYDVCKHLLLCSACAKLMKDKQCPTCRQVSKKFMHIVL